MANKHTTNAPPLGLQLKLPAPPGQTKQQDEGEPKSAKAALAGIQAGPGFEDEDETEDAAGLELAVVRLAVCPLLLRRCRKLYLEHLLPSLTLPCCPCMACHGRMITGEEAGGEQAQGVEG
jgi:hypothetical protein